MTQIIDNLLPRERPLGGFLGGVAVTLAQQGVSALIISRALRQPMEVIWDHLERAYVNGSLSIKPVYGFPEPFSEIEETHAVPRRKPPLRPNPKPKRRQGGA